MGSTPHALAGSAPCTPTRRVPLRAALRVTTSVPLCAALCMPMPMHTEHAPLCSFSGTRVVGAPPHFYSSAPASTFFYSDDEHAQRVLWLRLPYVDHNAQHLFNTDFEVRPLRTHSSAIVGCALNAILSNRL